MLLPNTSVRINPRNNPPTTSRVSALAAGAAITNAPASATAVSVLLAVSIKNFFIVPSMFLTVTYNIASLVKVVKRFFKKKCASRMRAVLLTLFWEEREGAALSHVVRTDEGGPFTHYTVLRSTMLDASQCSLRSSPNVVEMLRLSRRPLVLYAMTAHAVASY